ncbi:TraB family protein [Aphelenchoides avenae]|nr:TraB family protein [Aphelenchus avenae]
MKTLSRLQVVRRHSLRISLITARCSASQAAVKPESVEAPEVPLALNHCWLETLEPTFEPDIPSSEADAAKYREFFKQGHVYLMGTVHQNKKCADDVRSAIRHVKPDGVFAELDNTAKFRRYRSMKDAKFSPSEFRAAYEEAQALPGCDFINGDRPQEITDSRAWPLLPMHEYRAMARRLWKYGVKDAFWLVVAGLRGGTPSTSKDLDVARKFHREFFQKVADVFPHWHNAYITERDRYMTYQLQTFVEELSRRKFAQWKAQKGDLAPVEVVAVVGAGHVDGIVANWNTRVPHHEMTELMIVGAVETKLEWLRTFIQCTVLLTVVFIFYRSFVSKPADSEVNFESSAKAVPRL